ncbi:hypothetical protein ACFUYE_00655 [Micromonospora humida]|uniref:hypothetical protein n=1 Tax=Micromonospora humida TaxID=2809018 RepID=UPI0036700085
MTTIRVRLCETDRVDYGTDGESLPEVLTVDLEALKDLTASELEGIDRALNTPLALFLEPLERWDLRTAQVGRVAAWLAIHQHGSGVSFDDFQPRLLRARFDREVQADNPPAGPSEYSSEADPQAAPFRP